MIKTGTRGRSPARPAPGRPRGNTAERILGAAKDIIAKKGLDGLRIGDVSDALGISAPALYAHFPGGRSEMIDRIAQEGLAGMQAFFPLTGAAARDDLLNGVCGLVRFYAQNRAFLRIMLLEFSSPQGHPSITREIGPRRGDAAGGAFVPMFERLEAIIAANSRRPARDPVTASTLLNVMVGAAALNLIYPPPGHRDPAAAAERIVRDLVVRYLDLAPPAGPAAARPAPDAA
ncbi:MAG TPA: TetR/AcrR family transcriptional regulator, partial [Phenylobacterium sp.]|nr:TetR/AcrR family transcriptional regulator [Phenylobacterium sp.]